MQRAQAQVPCALHSRIGLSLTGAAKGAGNVGMGSDQIRWTKAPEDRGLN